LNGSVQLLVRPQDPHSTPPNALDNYPFQSPDCHQKIISQWNNKRMEKILIVKWKLKEPEALRILKMLPELVEKSKSEKGNISYTIYQSEHDPNELIIHEHYIDAAAAESHKQSEHYQRIVVNEIIAHLAVRDVMPVKKLF